MASPESSGWRDPIEVSWRDPIAYRGKGHIELCLPIDVGRKITYFMKTCSEFPLHLRDAAKEFIKIVHVYMQTSDVRFIRTVDIIFIDNLPTFPIMKSLGSCLKLLLICIIELGIGFNNSLPWVLIFGKSPCIMYDDVDYSKHLIKCSLHRILNIVYVVVHVLFRNGLRRGQNGRRFVNNLFKCI